MRFSLAKPVGLKDGAAKLVVKPDHLVEQLRVLNVVTLLVAIKWEVSRNKLLLRDIFKVKELTGVLILIVVEPA